LGVYIILGQKMPFENVKIIDPYVDNGMCAELKLVLANDDEVRAVESAARFSFPEGYREYVTTLGRGQYCNYIRIHMPAEILSGYREYQTFLAEYWFWDLGNEIISKERAIESVNIGDTVDGDVILFHPSNSNELFVLPRNDDTSHRIGANLYDAIDWLCVYRHNPHSGSVGETHERRYFVPWNPVLETREWLVPENI
jgi:hypothetical protein